MSEVTERVPIKCQSCPYFEPSLMVLSAIESGLRVAQSNRRALASEGDAKLGDLRSTIEGDIAYLEGQAAVAEDRIHSKLALTAGCPGACFDDSVGTGEPVRIGRCQSPNI